MDYIVLFVLIAVAFSCLAESQEEKKNNDNDKD